MACTVPAIALPVGTRPPKRLSLEPLVANLCERTGRYDVLEVGERIEHPYRRMGFPATCEPSPSSFADVYRRDVVVPAATFVSFEAVTEPVDERLAMTALRSQDGARMPTGLYDRGRGEPCEPLEAIDGAMRCLPSLWSMAQTSSLDESCRGSSVAIVTSFCSVDPPPIPRYGLVHDWTCTGMRYGVVELGSSIPPPAMFYNVDGAGQCTGFTSFLDNSIYIATRAVTMDLFLSLADVRMVGRLTPFRRPFNAAPDRFFDHQLGVACYPGPDRDGTTRCLPEGLRVEDAFSDATCSMPVRFATNIRIPDCRDAPVAPYASFFGIDGAHVYRIGSESHETLYARDLFSGVCGPRAYLNEIVFDVTEVAPSALALVETVQD